MEELKKQHQIQQTDLQARITQKKKNATKKTKKGVSDECADLERQLKDRQESELAAISGDTEAADTGDGLQVEKPLAKDADGSPDQSNNAIENPPSGSANTESGQSRAKKRNRQKERLARRAAEQEAVATQAAEEASNQNDPRAKEQEIMEREFKARGLVEQEVRSDGHCLYAAIADQLKQSGKPIGSDDMPDYKAVREDAATFIQANSDDFAPFLEEPLDEYVTKIRDTGEWGGQLELSALSKVYGVTINVLQGDGRVEKIESQDAPGGVEFWLAYYRHSFGLGEHYNSLRKVP